MPPIDPAPRAASMNILPNSWFPTGYATAPSSYLPFGPVNGNSNLHITHAGANPGYNFVTSNLNLPVLPPVGPTSSLAAGPQPGTVGGGAAAAQPQTAAGAAAPATPTAGKPGHCAHHGTTATGGGAAAGAGSVIAGGGQAPRRVGTNAARGPKTPLRFSIGDASFSFPSLARQAKSSGAPAVSWGPGWKRVQTGNASYMQHDNGTRAYQGVQQKISVTPRGKVRQVVTAHGPGKKMPDGTIVGIDKAGKPYMVKDGERRDIRLGTHTFGGVTVRLFKARTVRVVTPDGRIVRYDSRGNVRVPRGAAGVTGGGAATGAAQIGTGPLSGPLRGLLDQLISMTRNLLGQLDGEVDPDLIKQATALLDGLPAAMGQATSGAAQTVKPAGGAPQTPAAPAAPANPAPAAPANPAPAAPANPAPAAPTPAPPPPAAQPNPPVSGGGGAMPAPPPAPPIGGNGVPPIAPTGVHAPGHAH